jgi:hypothetical protein
MPVRLAIGRKGMTVKLLPGEPDRWLTDPDGDVARDLERRLGRMQVAARGYVRVRSGGLLSTIRKRIRFSKRALTGELLAGGGKVKHALVEELGSVPHEIRPNRRKALRFMAGGQVVFRRRVWHPGTTGSHYLERSLRAAR